MKILRPTSDLLEELKRIRSRMRPGQTIGFVPTMGALHRGHAELIRRARKTCDTVVVSVFVNPLQFGPAEDLAKYPRDLTADAGLCRRAGADILFAPDAKSFLKMKSLVSLRASASLKKYLCGPVRPGHFDGVVTIVAHFFRLIRPDRAFFGLKDYQQYVILDDMTRRCFGAKPEVVPVETVREKSGLAMSSRNRYLSPAEKKTAPVLYRALNRARRQILIGGPKDTALTAARALESLRMVLTASGPFRVQYLSICNARTLRPLAGPLRGGRKKILIAAAVYLGGTRLIDNVLV